MTGRLEISCVALALAALLATPGASHAKRDEWPSLNRPPRHEGGGENDAAVIVGIEDYFFVPDVAGAVANASDWYAWLTRTRGVPVGSVTLLRDNEATLEAMRKAAVTATERVQPGGTLWFVFIGHGAPAADGLDGILVGVDTQQTADSVYARGLIQRELIEDLTLGPQAQTLLLLDACFSGQSQGGGALVDGLQPMIPSYALDSTRVTVVTAGQSNQFAGPLPGVDRPAFSYLMLGGLRGWADQDEDREVTVAEAVTYTADALRSVVRGRTQTPGLVGPGADLVLSQGREGGPDLAALVLPEDDPRNRPAVTNAEVGSGEDLAALAEQVRRAREAEAELMQAQQDNLDDAEERLLARAEREWREVEPLLLKRDGEAASLAQEYIHKYRDASVSSAGATRSVEVPHLHAAQEVVDHVTQHDTSLREEHRLPASGGFCDLRITANLPRTTVAILRSDWSTPRTCDAPCKIQVAPGEYVVQFKHHKGGVTAGSAELHRGRWRVRGELVVEKERPLYMALFFASMAGMLVGSLTAGNVLDDDLVIQDESRFAGGVVVFGLSTGLFTVAAAKVLSDKYTGFKPGGGLP